MRPRVLAEGGCALAGQSACVMDRSPALCSRLAQVETAIERTIINPAGDEERVVNPLTWAKELVLGKGVKLC